MKVAGPEDKAEIEAIINHPEVLPSVSCDGAPPFDATPYLTAPNIALLMNGGCFLGAWDDTGRFECHTAFLTEFRGENAMAEADKALRHVFLNTLCQEVVTKVPACNKGAQWLARNMGFKTMFNRHRAWIVNHEAWSIGYCGITIDEWICAGHCRDAGAAFHDKLDAMRPGLEHPRDDAHNCYVGAAVAMVRANNTDKAILFYNRFARLAGYQQITKVSDDPLVLDLVDFKITVRGGDFFVEE